MRSDNGAIYKTDFCLCVGFAVSVFNRRNGQVGCWLTRAVSGNDNTGQLAKSVGERGASR